MHAIGSDCTVKLKAGLPAPPGAGCGVSAFDQAYVTRARSLGGLFRRKFHTLPFSQQLEDRAPHGTALHDAADA